VLTALLAGSIPGITLGSYLAVRLGLAVGSRRYAGGNWQPNVVLIRN
jgi:hypothetical protein